MSFDLTVHHFEKQGNMSVLKKIDPYAKICDPNTGHKCYIRAGKAWSSDGKVIKPTPEWAIDQIKMWTDKAKEEMGFGHLIAHKVEVEVPLQVRMKNAVAKGLMTLDEYETMFPKADSESLPEANEDNVEVDESENPEVVTPEVTDDYGDLTRSQLMALCKAADIEIDRTDTKETLMEKIRNADRSS
jgi:hypothetical protein